MDAFNDMFTENSIYNATTTTGVGDAPVTSEHMVSNGNAGPTSLADGACGYTVIDFPTPPITNIRFGYGLYYLPRNMVPMAPASADLAEILAWNAALLAGLGPPGHINTVHDAQSVIDSTALGHISYADVSIPTDWLIDNHQVSNYDPNRTLPVVVLIAGGLGIPNPIELAPGDRQGPYRLTGAETHVASTYTGGGGAQEYLQSAGFTALPVDVQTFMGQYDVNTGFQGTAVKADDYRAVKQNTEFRRFFNQAANPLAMLMGPLMYNLHLSSVYYSDGEGAFDNTLEFIISLLEKLNNTDQPPALAPRTAAGLFNNNMAQGADGNLEGLAREIFLKFLRETPLMILKGLVELIDPHVAISKFIRDITAGAFGQVAKGITPVIQEVDIFEAAGTRGEDLLNLAFCGYNLGNKFASDAAAGTVGTATSAESDAPMFGPTITMKGVDFTGSIAGLFMAPPSPLGILYLLLRFLLNQSTDSVGGETEECVPSPLVEPGLGDEACPPEES